MTDSVVFDSGDSATIASGMKIHAKLGRVVINDNHLGFLRENGDLIDSAPLAEVLIKKGLTYGMVPTLHVVLNGTKYQLNLSYQARINAGQDDGTAKDAQREENKQLVTIVKQLGGQVKGL